MIVVSGKGYWSVVVLNVMVFICFYTFPSEMRNYVLVVPLLITGLFSYFYGHSWNNQPESIFLDETSGQNISVKNSHEVFWMPMQYAGILFMLLAMFILFLKDETIGLFIIMLILVGITFIEFKKIFSETAEPKSSEQKLKGTKFRSKAIKEKAVNFNALKASLIAETTKRKRLTEMTEEELTAYHKKYMPK